MTQEAEQKPPLVLPTGNKVSADAFVALARAVNATKATTEESDEKPAELWRWSKHGHGSYAGKWYRWTYIADRRITKKGGELTPTIRAELERTHPRKGRGNHNTGTKRVRKSKATNDTTRISGVE